MNGRDLSTYQAFLLGTIIEREEWSGIELRQSLKEAGYGKTGPAFYASMTRLEKLNLISSKYIEEEVRGHVLKVKVFRIKGAGKRAFKEWQQFILKFHLGETVKI